MTTETTEAEERAAKSLCSYYGDFGGEWSKYVDRVRIVAAELNQLTEATRPMTQTTITDSMVEKACRAYVRGVQKAFDDDVPDFNSDEWRQFEDQNWSNESLPIRLALEAALLWRNKKAARIAPSGQ